MKTAAERSRCCESEYVVLYGVPWATYEGVLDALGSITCVTPTTRARWKCGACCMA
jgi:hypothetical protein